MGGGEMRLFANVCLWAMVLMSLLPCKALGGARFEELKKDWTIYLVQHTHTDIGYTRPQTEILSEHLRYIDYAIDYCDRTRDYPDAARFRWTCEAAWAVAEYIRVRPESQIRRLKDCIRRGQIEITAMYFNMAEVADENSLRYFLLPLAALKEQGIPVRLAMQNDVNGIAWCLADYLPDLGVRYLWMGEHTHKALEPFDKPTVFRWESPSGNGLYAFRAEHYMTGNFWGLPDGKMEDVEANLRNYLKSLEDRSYPFSEIGIQFSGSYTDNAPPSTSICDFIAAWNEKYDTPKLRSATAQEFMDQVVSHYPDQIPTYRAAWPDWWTDGFGSAARETGQARRAQADLLSAQALLSMAALQGVPLPEGSAVGIRKIHDDLLFYDEHTFGASESIWDSSSWQTAVQWGIKGAYAWTARKDAGMLYETAGGLLQDCIHRDSVPTLTFFNPLAWERDAFCDVFIDFTILPQDGSCVIEDADGQVLPMQVLSERREGRYYRVFVKGMPSLGYRTCRIVRRSAPASGEEVSLVSQDSTFVLVSPFYRVVVDAVRGGVRSLWDKKAGRELVDAGSCWELGQPIRETLSDRHNLELKNATGLDRHAVRDVRVREGNSGPLFRSLTVTASSEGLSSHGITCELRLYAQMPVIELCYSARPLAQTDPNAWYVAFPFVGERLAFDVPGGVVRPGENQLEGTSSTWNTMQNFVASRSENHQILLSSREVPLVQLGGLMDGPFQYIKQYGQPHVFSWVTNNYWVTNFKASQDGEIRWSYALTSLPGQSDGDALRFSIGDRVPLYGRTLPAGIPDSCPLEGSQLTVMPSDVTVTAICPSQDGRHIILHIRETSGRDGVVFSLLSQGRMLRFDRVDALERVLGHKLSSCLIPAQGNLLVRVDADPAGWNTQTRR